MAHSYNSPPGTPSTIGDQQYVHHYYRKAIIDAKDDMYFSQLSNALEMPAHYGKTIKANYYVPILDDRNQNDQGLDAAGAFYANGNLYGSSKDIGLITSRLPVLGEGGGRVNRVGSTRIEREATIQNYGIFQEWTEDSLNFDSDMELFEHMSRELIEAANQINEGIIQMDLLLGAGTEYFAGVATSMATITGEGSDISIVDYQDFSRVDILLDELRTPKQTKIITGSVKTDTRTLRQGRLAYIGTELQAHVQQMLDTHGNPAFIHVNQYADAGTAAFGEIGSIGAFRIIVPLEMFHWEGAGAVVDENPGYRDDGTNYNVYPILIVGDDSFTTIGFYMGANQTGTASDFKFRMRMRKPGEGTQTKDDPYMKEGIAALDWWHATLIKRPERILVIKTVAPE